MRYKSLLKMDESNSINNITIAVKAIKQAISQSRYRIAVLANSELLSLYYGIGKYISDNSRKGFWGKGAIETISSSLQQELPGLRGFGTANLKYMRLFYEGWSDIISRHLASDENSLSNRHSTSDESQIDCGYITRQINHFEEPEWHFFLMVPFTHHREILNKTSTVKERFFYITHCATEFWSVEKLKFYLADRLYEKQGSSITNFDKTIKEKWFKERAIKMFKNEYLLDFIKIEDPDEVDERVIEQEIVCNVKRFIMALGGDFSFIGNQYRLVVEEQEYFIDLLFFNRRLQSLIAIELKNGAFKPEYAGKMNFYLSALDEYVKLPNENPSIGIILCKSQKQKIVEFAFRDTSKPMGVATYKTANELPIQYKGLLPDVEDLKKLF